MGLSLILTILVLNMALCLLKVIEQPFDLVFNAQKASEILLLSDTRKDDQENLAQWISDQDEVLGVSEPSPYLMLSPPLIHQEKELDFNVQLTEYNRGHANQDQLRIAKGETREYPGYGKIWLPSHFESSYGLQLGDSLGFRVNGELRQLKISAFVIDPHYLSPLFNPTRAWVAPGTLPLLVPISELSSNMIGVRLNSSDELDSFWKRFKESLSYAGSSLQYPLFKGVYMSFYSLLSSVLLIFSIMGLLISLLIINYTLSSHILSDYKQIGVLKGLGFTPASMVFLYLMQMGVVSLMALPLGLLISWGLTRMVILWITESMGVPDSTYNLGGTFLLSFVLVLFLVLVISLISARKAGLVKPIKAIRNSFKTTRSFSKKFSPSLVALRLPLSMLLGGRFLSSNSKNLIFTVINMTGIVFVLVFCVNISNSFDKIHKDRTAWGFDNSDIVVNRSNSVLLALKHEQLMEMLEPFEEIQTINPFSYTNLFVLSDKNKAVKEIHGKVYSSSLLGTGLENIVGKHPIEEDEISLCIGTAKEFKKSPGDQIRVFIEGQKKLFTITGIYQDVGNLGQGFRLQEEAMLHLNPLHEPRHYGLELSQNVDRDTFRSELQTQFGETIQTELSVEERAAMVSMVGNIRMAVLIISLFFVLVLVVIIYNDQNIYIQQNKTSFVKLKSLGFTFKKLKAVLLWKTTLNLALAVLLGIPLSLWLSPGIMNVLTADIGLVRFPFLPHFQGIFLVLIILFLLGGLSAWLAANTIRKIDFRVISST